MTTLSIDIETYSSTDLKKTGVYRYVEADDFEILLFAYAFGDDPVEVIDLAQGEKLPVVVIKALQDREIMKTAFNANFERVCISKHFDIKQYETQWRCTAVKSMNLGLPGYLDGVAKAMNLDVQKDSAGKALIRYFSMPCKPNKKNEGRTRNLPHHDEEKWQQYKDYCVMDVEVERGIKEKLDKFQLPDMEHRMWELDQKINDFGVEVDPDVVKNAIEINRVYQKKLKAEAIELTGLDNPNSTAQLGEWLKNQGVQAPNLQKATVEKLLEETSGDVKRVLEIRLESSKTSIKKYQAMERAMCEDHRVRGLMQFYGAGRTGRWAGRLVQVQNLPRNYLNDLDLARNLLKQGEFETLELLFGDVPDVLSQLIRTAFVPKKGYRLTVSDFSAIEARVIAWLADETWRLDVFDGHGKIYEASAAQMFNVPVESISKGDPLRQKGKISELALGYQGSVGALKQMGALDMGLEEDELPELVSSWREANPNIKKFWYDVEKSAIQALQNKTTVTMPHGLSFFYQSGVLFIGLPSGRKLAYAKPKLEKDERFNKDKITYMGTEAGGKWARLDTYGGKLVENIVQAVARDCLALSMIRLDDAGYDIIFHVHDEAVIETLENQDALEDIEGIMGQPIEWAKGLPLNADGFVTHYYMKD
ncbi:DNA polymerase [Halobacillus shinanisalinarum]|uniref:DNA-directed DNA polymerase n=1 Tax=Halobacillus shinanisalinarum TaxID=2932258 RepID=A0ABY4H172_9BACI|nr:DNA polymerase [Halobacillus shinanisalinarum]UOQ93392.1 DNA polymerase [Halobacillus shinanisalinarum]